MSKLTPALKKIWDKITYDPFFNAKMESFIDDDKRERSKITLDDGQVYVGDFDVWYSHPDDKRAGFFIENSLCHFQKNRLIEQYNREHPPELPEWLKNIMK